MLRTMMHTIHLHQTDLHRLLRWVLNFKLPQVSSESTISDLQTSRIYAELAAWKKVHEI